MPRNLLSVGIAALLAVAMLAQTSRLLGAPGAWRDTATGLAIGGYDPVAYFTHKAPTPGREGVEHRWGGVVWLFDNSGNRDAFVKHPQIYTPGFAGYDASALAEGLTVEGLPVVWAMYNQRVYLFRDAASLRKWQRDRQTITAAAQANWERLAKELPGMENR
ncbi:MAG: YHS domain-containing (seleno)protein [Methyloligellaceae bacterium]